MLQKIAVLCAALCLMAGAALAQDDALITAPQTHITLAESGLSADGIAKGPLGSVVYAAEESTDALTGETVTTYTLDEAASTTVRVSLGDQLTLSGTMTAPQGETLGMAYLNIYTMDTEAPYETGAQVWRAYNIGKNSFDLSGIPGVTLDTAGDVTFEAGKTYILSLYATTAKGSAFEDTDAQVEGIQGPAVILSIKHDATTCPHPHENYVYKRHASGETQTIFRGDAHVHMVDEPLMERYCSLCDSYLGLIWGQGTAEEHWFGDYGVCVICGYSPMGTLMEESADYTITIPASIDLSEEGERSTYDLRSSSAGGLIIHVSAMKAGTNVVVSASSENGGVLTCNGHEIPYTYDESITFTEAGTQVLSVSVDPDDAEGVPAGTYTDTLTFTTTSVSAE